MEEPVTDGLFLRFWCLAPSPSRRFGPAAEVKERLHLLARKQLSGLTKALALFLEGGKELELFLQLFIIIIATKLAGVLSVRLGQPSVLGKLIIGVLIGPAVFDWVQNTEVIEALSHIGVLLLMFIAGLETDLKELNRNKNSSLAVAFGGVILPLIGGYLSGIAIGMNQSHAIFLGLIALCDFSEYFGSNL